MVGALRAEDRGEEVQRDDALGEARARGGGVGRRATPRVVHEHVDAAELLDDRVDERERGFAVADVTGEERPVGGQVVDGIARADGDGRAGVGEPGRDAAADALGAAGDEHDLAGEIELDAHDVPPAAR